MEHTPGPWRVSIDCDAVLTDTGSTDDEIICLDGFEHDVMAVQDVDERAANMILIAAAPELADTLRAILEVWDEHKIIGPMMYHDARALLDKIDAA